MLLCTWLQWALGDPDFWFWFCFFPRVSSSEVDLLVLFSFLLPLISLWWGSPSSDTIALFFMNGLHLCWVLLWLAIVTCGILQVHVDHSLLFLNPQNAKIQNLKNSYLQNHTLVETNFRLLFNVNICVCTHRNVNVFNYVGLSQSLLCNVCAIFHLLNLKISEIQKCFR